MSKVLVIFFGAVYFFTGCNRKTVDQDIKKQSKILEVADVQSDTVIIEKLVRQVLDWSNSPDAIVIDPVLEKDGIYYWWSQVSNATN